MQRQGAMQRAAACLLVVLLASASALAKRSLLQPGRGLGPNAGYGQPGGCPGKGRALQGESCQQFVEYFRAQADAYMALTDADFQAVVDKSPVPSDTCCHDARNFVLSGCTCSRQLTNAPGSSVSPTALKCITRATQASVCSKSAWINDPCQENGGRPAVSSSAESAHVTAVHPTANRAGPKPASPAPAPAAPAPASPAPAPSPQSDASAGPAAGPAPAPAPAAAPVAASPPPPAEQHSSGGSSESRSQDRRSGGDAAPRPLNALLPPRPQGPPDLGGPDSSNGP